MPLYKRPIEVSIDVTDIENNISALQASDTSQNAAITTLETEISSFISIPATVKTVAASGDYFIGIDSTEMYKITKANLLVGLSSGGSSGGSGGSDYPTVFTHWHDESTVTVGASLTQDYAANNPYGLTSYQPSNAIGDSFSFDVFVEAGTYDVSFLGHAYTNRGLAAISVNGTVQYSDLDFYGFNTIVKLNRSIVMPVSGLNTVTITVAGKNTSSSAYYITLTKVWGKKVS